MSEVKTKPKKEVIELDYDKIGDVELEGIDTKDYPDFADARVVSFFYDGRVATDDEVSTLNDDTSWVYERVLEQVF